MDIVPIPFNIPSEQQPPHSVWTSRRRRWPVLLSSDAYQAFVAQTPSRAAKLEKASFHIGRARFLTAAVGAGEFQNIRLN
jgi:hypothetical protein